MTLKTSGCCSLGNKGRKIAMWSSKIQLKRLNYEILKLTALFSISAVMIILATVRAVILNDSLCPVVLIMACPAI
jgi:hypothetical protein